MTEEVTESVIETPPEEVVVKPTVEEIAREKGWKPEAEYEGDSETWVDADEFVKREPLYKALHKVNRENKKLKEMLVEVKTMFKNVQETSKAQAMQDLKQQFEQASAEGNIKQAVQVHDKMKELDAVPAPKNQGNEIEAAFTQWKQENAWFDSDPTLRRFANGYANEVILDKCKDLGVKVDELTLDDVNEIYAEVAKQVKNEFPDKFVNPNRKRAATVNESSKRTSNTGDNGTGKKKYSLKDLPDDTTRVVARNLLRSKVFETEAEYMEQYIAGGGTLAGQE